MPKSRNKNENAIVDPDSMPEVVETEFQVPASDEKGHDRRMILRIHPGYITELSKVVQSRDFPYETPHQIVRHAIKRHLAWLASIKPLPNSTLNRLNAINAILYEEEEQQKFKDMLVHMGTLIAEDLANGAAISAMSLVRRAYAEVDLMADSDRKQQYIREIRSKWGWMLDGVVGTNGVANRGANGETKNGTGFINLLSMSTDEAEE